MQKERDLQAEDCGILTERIDIHTCENHANQCVQLNVYAFFLWGCVHVCQFGDNSKGVRSASWRLWYSDGMHRNTHIRKPSQPMRTLLIWSTGIIRASLEWKMTDAFHGPASSLHNAAKNQSQKYCDWKGSHKEGGGAFSGTTLCVCTCACGCNVFF